MLFVLNESWVKLPVTAAGGCGDCTCPHLKEAETFGFKPMLSKLSKLQTGLVLIGTLPVVPACPKHGPPAQMKITIHNVGLKLKGLYGYIVCGFRV